MTAPSAYRRGGKRIVDLLGSALAVLVLAPVLSAVAVGSAVKQGRPILFCQRRAGRDGQPFVLRKFRTMSSEAGSDDQRVTEWGRFLRHSSLDELPQLVNVLVGDMSLVGPRPLYLHYIPLYSTEQAERLRVRPGLTGLAQINGRNRLAWDDRLRLDTHYARTVSLRSDLDIVRRTVLLLIRRSSTDALHAETPPEFAGSVPQEAT